VKCKKCGKNVKDKTIIKHMWADHRAHMMKNHVGGVGAKKKAATKPEPKTVKRGRPRLSEIPVNGAWNQVTYMRSTYVATGKPLKVIIHQNGQTVEILNVSRVEVVE